MSNASLCPWECHLTLVSHWRSNLAFPAGVARLIHVDNIYSKNAAPQNQIQLWAGKSGRNGWFHVTHQKHGARTHQTATADRSYVCYPLSNLCINSFTSNFLFNSITILIVSWQLTKEVRELHKRKINFIFLDSAQTAYKDPLNIEELKYGTIYLTKLRITTVIYQLSKKSTKST